MKILKFGCLVIVIIIATIVVVAVKATKSSGPPPVIVSSQPEKRVEVDPFEKKYRISKSQAESTASNFAKDIVRKNMSLADNYAFPWTSEVRYVFEFEKNDADAKRIGDWVGVNIKNKIKVKDEDHEYSGTFHYDPITRKWLCDSFVIDGEKITPVK